MIDDAKKGDRNVMRAVATTLTIDERIGDDGGSVVTAIEVTPESFGESFRIIDASAEVGELSIATLDAVMNRYAKALDESIVLEGPSLDLAADSRIVMLRHRAIYDVIARDFLVIVTPQAEPRAALATTIAAALVHLARAANGR